MAKPGFYAVAVGRTPGVYTTWEAASAQVNGFTGAKHQKFPTREQALAYLNSNPSSGKRPAETQPEGSLGTKSMQTLLTQPNKRSKTDVEETKANSKGLRTVFCDGSCLGNGQKGSTAGLGVCWITGDNVAGLDLSERLPGDAQTNNRAEMYAVARILETDPHPELPLLICTDSQYTISVFKEWIPGWRRRGWKTAGGTPVLNRDLIEYVLALLASRKTPNSPSTMANVSFQKVKAHVGIEANEKADNLAKAGARMAVVADVDFDAKRKKLETTKGAQGKDVDVATYADEEWLLSLDELRKMSESQSFD